LLYLIAFFIHMVGVVNLVGGFILFNQAGVLYRRAATWEAARSFLTMLQFAPGMLIAGAILLLVSGAYMGASRWGLGAPWVTAGVATALLALAIAIFVLGPEMRRLRKITEGKDGPIFPQDRRALVASGMWPWGAVTNGVALAIAWNMVMKPGWALAIALPIVLGAVGWLVSFLLARAARKRAIS
jgi:hypothetical protein